MTSPVALPVAALRVVRAAAGRRALDLALRVTLLAGGLIALGLLCGGRAHAAEGVLPPPENAGDRAVHAPAVTDAGAPTAGAASAVTDTGAPTATADAASAAARAGSAGGTHASAATRAGSDCGTHASAVRAIPARERAVEPASARVAGHVRSRVAEPVRAQVVEPLVRDVREVVRPVGELAGRVVGGLLADAPPRFLPRPPSMPGIPGQPGVPGALTPPGDGAHAAPAPSAAAHTDADTGHGDHARPGTPDAAATGGDFTVAPATGVTTRTTAAKAARTPVPAPAFPSGSTLGQSAGDGSSTRHCDLAAAAFGNGSTARLLAGPTASSRAAATRDRHRDIPEFPG